jgi:uncharacterized protein (DUF1778 family)
MQEKRTLLTIEVTEEQRAALRKAAYRTEQNMSELVRSSVATTLRDVAPEFVAPWETALAGRQHTRAVAA